MPSVIYNEFKRASAAGEIALATDDIRAKLVMTNSTCGTENDGIVDIADFTTLDLANATGYVDVALVGETVVKDDVNDRAEFSSNDIVFSGLSGDATRDYLGILLYKYVDGTDLNDLVIAFSQFTSAIPAAATQVTVPAPVEGFLQLA